MTYDELKKIVRELEMFTQKLDKKYLNIEIVNLIKDMGWLPNVKRQHNGKHSTNWAQQYEVESVFTLRH